MQIINHLDTCGLKCPEPLMLIHKNILQIQPGDVLQVTATDPSTHRDVVKFCEFLGHKLISNIHNDGVWQFIIQKS